MPGDDTNRISIIEQGDAIRIIQGGLLLRAPFMALTSKVNPAGKKSYLGWCFMRISVRTPILRTGTDNYPPRMAARE